MSDNDLEYDNNSYIPIKYRLERLQKKVKYINRLLYDRIHVWIRKNKIKPELCEICGKPEFYDSNHGRLELSNITGKLIKDIDNFQYVHCSCHRKYDKKSGIIHEGVSTFNEYYFREY